MTHTLRTSAVLAACLMTGSAFHGPGSRLTAADDKKEIPADLKPFQGEWKVVKAEAAKGAPPLKDEVHFTFTGNKLSIREGRLPPQIGTYAVDSNKEPPEFDLIAAGGQKNLGIYRFETDGKLTLSYVPKPGSPRPKKMGEGDAVVVVLEKVKEKKEIAKELLPFQGTWKSVKIEVGGKEPPTGAAPPVRFTFAADTLTIVEEKGEPQVGIYTVNPKKEPAEIDLITPELIKLAGIFKFEKNGRLVITAVLNPKALRPKKFDEAETITYVLEKVKE